MESYLATLILLSIIDYVHGNHIFAALGDDVQLPLDSTCGAEENLKLFHLPSDDSKQLVASLRAANFSPGPLYADRLKLGSSGLLLGQVTMNDARNYELTCGGRVTVLTELHVINAVEVSAFEGETVNLPCHSVTLGVSLESVEWGRGSGEAVLSMNGSSGSFTRGEKFRGRDVSVSHDWRKTGNCSLRIKVKKGDEGVFFCRKTDRSGVSLAGAARLSVRSTIPDLKSTETPKSSSQPPESQCAECVWRTLFIITAVLLALAVILLLFLVLYRKGKFCTTSAQGSSRDREREGESNANGVPLIPRRLEEGLTSSRSDNNGNILRSSGSL